MSNLKSLYIKQNPGHSESLSATEFVTLYNAIMDISTYWQTNISQQAQYLRDMNLSAVVDITGNITVNKAAMSQVQAVCYWANGSATDYTSKLNISVSKYYLEFKDPVCKQVMENIFKQLRANNVINSEPDDEETGITTDDVKSLTRSSNEVPRPECIIQGVFAEERATDNSWFSAWGEPPAMTETKKNELRCTFDYFLYNSEQNRLKEMKVLDFTPFCNYFTFSQQGEPKLISYAPRTAKMKNGSESVKNLDELWAYVHGQWVNESDPARQKTGTTWSNELTIDWSHHNQETSIASGEANGSRVTKFFVKTMGTYDQSNGAQYGGAKKTWIVEHKAIDIGRYVRHQVFSYTFNSKNLIIIDSMKERYTIDEGLNSILYRMLAQETTTGLTNQDRISYMNEAKNYIQKNYLDTGIITSFSGDNGTGIYKNNFATYVTQQWDGNIVTEDCGNIFVRDELYWWYVCAPLIGQKVVTDGRKPSTIAGVGTNSTFDDSAVTAYMEDNVNYKYKCLSQYKTLFEYNPLYYNRDLGKFWWQCNSALNTVIQKEYALYDDPYYNIYT